MCRIVGFWDFNSQNNYNKKEVLRNMRDTLQYGGPDNGGEFFDEQNALSLGHRRLSILDLSEAGNQPFYWKHFVIIFNGEVYNFKEIQNILIKNGYSFTTSSDTEVVIKAFELWGKEAVHYFRGMFAFAIWDTQEKKLTLCRDRLGVKPLYWYFKDDLFMFGSELKAFHEHPKFDKTINHTAVSLFLQQGYITAPNCIFKYAHKLETGSFLEIDCSKSITKTNYWAIDKIYQNTSVSTKDEETLTEELETLLKESFRLRMVADVPVGMFLSGGIDSSLVTAVLQKEYNRPLKTFTIGFENKEYNEAEHAKRIAQHIGTDHTELYCTEKDFRETVPKLSWFYDEPFGDPSGLPTFLVSELARKQVVVSLSADGGDEIFGGYSKYDAVINFYPKIQRMPTFARRSLQLVSGQINPLWLERNASKIPVLKNYKNVANKFPKFVNALQSKSLIEFFNTSSTYIDAKSLTKLHQTPILRYDTTIQPKPDQLVSFLGMMDIQTYLEGDILTKVDRATMQVALEGREPFLDHKLIEFAMQLPDNLKIRGKSTKYILRKILYKYVPKELIERPKQGFSVPVHQWLNTVLKDTVLNMIEDTHFLKDLQLNQTAVRELVHNFYNQKKYINPHFIWFLYNLYTWHQRWIKGNSIA